MPLHRTRRRGAFRVLLIAAALSGALSAATESTTARGAELIAPGINPKLAANAGQTVSRGPSALFFNPANLIFSKFVEPYVDVSFASVTYTYQHTDTEKYAPATVKVAAPPVTAGLAIRPTPSFAFGAAIVPTGTGAIQQVQAVPVQVTGDAYQVCDISTKNTGFKAAVGGAFRFDFPITIGVGAIYQDEKTELLVTPVDEATGEEADEAVLDAIYAGNSTQFVIGARSEILDRYLAIALSYKTAVEKHYTGDYLLNLTPESDYVAYEGVGYTPASIGFGLEGRIGPVAPFLDVLYEQWSAGRAIYKRGLGIDKDEIDYVDTINVVAGVKFWIAKKHMLTVAGGMYGGNVGDGTVRDTGRTLQDDGSEDPIVGGVAFGDLEAIPRTVAALGYRAKISGAGFFEAGAQYQTGSRVVPEGADGEGTYTLSVIMGSVGVAYGF